MQVRKIIDNRKFQAQKQLMTNELENFPAIFMLQRKKKEFCVFPVLT